MRIQRSLTGAICLALILTIGVNLGWAVLVAWITNFVALGAASGFVYEVLVFRNDGLPLIDRRDGTKSEKRSLDGQPYAGPQEFAQLSGANLPGQRDFFSHLDWGSRLVGFRDDDYSSTFWYFVVGEGTPRVSWFEGFDSRTKQRVGFLGANGFQNKRPRGEQCFLLREQIPTLIQLLPDMQYGYTFYEAGNAPAMTSVHLASQDSIFRLDLKKREVHKIANVPGLLAIGFARSADTRPQKVETDRKAKFVTWENTRGWFVCGTANEIVMIDYDDHEQISFPIPAELRGRPLIVYGGREPTQITLQENQLRQDGTAAYRLIWLSSAGKIEREERPILRQTTAYQSDIARMLTVGIICPMPIGILFDIVVIEPETLVSSGFEPSYSVATWRCVRNGWPVFAAISLLSAALAVITYRRHKRFDLPYAGLWFVFVLILGAPGFLGYLWHRTWPVREPCPSCREPTPRDRESCSECGEAFPPPARKGIEVLA